MAKKVGAIVSLSIIGVLIIATIILANLKVDYSIQCNKPDSIWVNGSVANETEMNEIINYINDVFDIFIYISNNNIVCSTCNFNNIVTI